jgi:hypothetical protein
MRLLARHVRCALKGGRWQVAPETNHVSASVSVGATALGRRFCGALTDLAEPSLKRSCIVWSFCIEQRRNLS